MTIQPATSLAADIDTLTAQRAAALESNSDEIARLAEALRQAEKSRTDDYREHCEAVRLVMAQRDAARAEIEKGHVDRIADNRVLLSQIDDARQDAERLANTCELAVTYMDDGAFQTARDRLASALAVHAAATGKQVTK